MRTPTRGALSVAACWFCCPWGLFAAVRLVVLLVGAMCSAGEGGAGFVAQQIADGPSSVPRMRTECPHFGW
jgi:hypothetical protein